MSGRRANANMIYKMKVVFAARADPYYRSLAHEIIIHAHDAALEATFGVQPPLHTPSAHHAEFAHDGDLATLVANALDVIAHD